MIESDDNIAPWLIKAKVSPPRRNYAAFFREGVKERLSDARQFAVSLIEAPAGFGKSTLLAEWAEELKEQNVVAAWLSAEEADDPDSFVSYLAFAFHVAGLDMSEHGLLSSHFKGENRIAFGLNALIAAIERSEKPAILVLDDFDRTAADVINLVVSRLLTNLPENLHLLIACRHNPGLSLSRVEIEGLLRRIGAEELRLGLAEVHKIFDPRLSEADAELIVERTAGWPVVIQLLKSVCGSNPVERHERITNFSGDSEQAAAYFSEQLFDSLTGEQRQFLEETSVLERVSARLADDLRRSTDSHALINSLVSLGSLFPENEPGGEIRRLHPLLREHLERKLQRNNPQWHAELHSRVSHEKLVIRSCLSTGLLPHTDFSN